MKISKQNILGSKVKNLWAIWATVALGVVGIQGQIFLTVEGSNGQANLFEGVADQFLNILIHGNGELVGGANFRIQIGNTGENSPTIQGLDLAGSADTPTFWTGNNQGQTVTFSPTGQASEGVITTTDAQPTISVPTDPTLFARVQVDGTGFTAGQSFGIFMENILGNDFIDTQILDQSGSILSTSLGAGSVTFTPVPEPVDAVLWVGMSLFVWSFLRKKSGIRKLAH